MALTGFLVDRFVLDSGLGPAPATASDQADPPAAQRDAAAKPAPMTTPPLLTPVKSQLRGAVAGLDEDAGRGDVLAVPDAWIQEIQRQARDRARSAEQPNAAPEPEAPLHVSARLIAVMRPGGAGAGGGGGGGGSAGPGRESQKEGMEAVIADNLENRLRTMRVGCELQGFQIVDISPTDGVKLVRDGRVLILGFTKK